MFFITYKSLLTLLRSLLIEIIFGYIFLLKDCFCSLSFISSLCLWETYKIIGGSWAAKWHQSHCFSISMHKWLSAQPPTRRHFNFKLQLGALETSEPCKVDSLLHISSVKLCFCQERTARSTCSRPGRPVHGWMDLHKHIMSLGQILFSLLNQLNV